MRFPKIVLLLLAFTVLARAQDGRRHGTWNKKKTFYGIFGGMEQDQLRLYDVKPLPTPDPNLPAGGVSAVASATETSINWGFFMEKGLKSNFSILVPLRVKSFKSRLLFYHHGGSQPEKVAPYKAILSIPLLFGYRIGNKHPGWNIFVGPEPKLSLNYPLLEEDKLLDLGFYFATGPAYDVSWLRAKILFYYGVAPFKKRQQAPYGSGMEDLKFTYQTLGFSIYL